MSKSNSVAIQPGIQADKVKENKIETGKRPKGPSPLQHLRALVEGMPEGLRRAVNMLAAPILIVLLWQAVSSSGLVLEVVLPSPVRVIQGLGKIIADGTLATDLKSSGYRILVGYLWGGGLGLCFGLSCGLSKLIERMVCPIVDMIRQIPTFAWIPLIILWFGIGDLSKYIIIGKAVFVPIFLNTMQGIKGVSNDYVEVARVLEIPYFKRMRKVILPSALPSIFTGLRLGAGNSWMAVVAAEMLGGLTGLGYGLLKAKDFLETDKLMALMVVIGVLGLVIDRILLLMEKRVLHWRNSFGAAGR